ncbi:ATP-dependent DNA helicase [Marinigracilibium pacificum]|uniref:ATP-dependent DNA helicase n=1 Tax=Marinigracilibium pacificum TaxID=2729599 RepID=UPI00232A56CD|nr:AAA family ATPase [Marinigracilibium pacificum]
MGRIKDLIVKNFPFDPTPDQNSFLEVFETFIKDTSGQDVLILKGYAGTGKTTVLSAINRCLGAFRWKIMMLAPTGRAAKVMATYSKSQAFTIHKLIYKQQNDPDAGTLSFKRQPNYFKNTLFIVDEASMIGDEFNFGKQGLLTDLMEYVFEKPQNKNKLLIVGDPAQLPPVGLEESPALTAEGIEKILFYKPEICELTQVTRQDIDSGILLHANDIRHKMFNGVYDPVFNTAKFTDIFKMTTERMEDGLRYAYDKYGQENTAVVCRSNYAAVQYNKYIRQVIHWYEHEVEAGELLMVVRNNYFFLPEDSPAGFIANGDFIEVIKMYGEEEMYGYRFATMRFRMLDYPDQEPVEAKVLLDTLHQPEASLSSEASRELYITIRAELEQVAKNKKDLKELIRSNPYINALQIKYAYALTCHKSQGGQWDAVFLDRGYFPKEKQDKEYMRWIYTAVTRAKKELYLIEKVK